LGEALRLGRARAINIVKLSAAFGVIAAVIGIGPSLALILLGDKSPPGVSLIHLAQTGLSPVTMALNFVVLLAIMSIALEDFTPRAAFGRAGSVLRSGWWAFLVVIGLTAAAVIVSAITLVVPPVIIAPTIFLDPRTGILLTLGSCACTGLLAGFFLLFTAVFTQTLYTLVYRAAARLTQPK
jgi:hypothetical protein